MSCFEIMRVWKYIVAPIISLAVGIGSVHGDELCTPLNKEVGVRSTLASAGFFVNLRSADHSIKARMDSLMSEARSTARDLVSRERMCASRCVNARVAVVFHSTPHQRLSNYDEAAACEVLLERTSKVPIVYSGRRFASEEQVREWYNDLTQGDGADGEDLYKRCPGACSPSYSSEVYRDGAELVASTSIVCGHARDKDDNQYLLTAGVKWICL